MIFGLKTDVVRKASAFLLFLINMVLSNSIYYIKLFSVPTVLKKFTYLLFNFFVLANRSNKEIRLQQLKC